MTGINIKKNKTGKFSTGFTITELLVVISIISLLALVVVANYRAGEKHYALQRSAHKLAQNIRRAQEMAMAAREMDGRIIHGIKVVPGNNYYYFISCDNDNNCSEEEEVKLEPPILIKETSPAGEHLIIKFVPPDPQVIFEPESDEVSLTLYYSGGPDKSITVNRAGLIELQ